MEPVSLGVIFIAVMLFLLIIIGLPIGFCLALTGALGIWAISGWDSLFDIISHRPFAVASDYVFTTIPMFVFMGWLAAEGGISADLFIGANRWFGWMRGGLAMAVSWACAAFGAVCGCSITTGVTMASISLPEMRRRNYDNALSTGVLSASGNLGILIPPSIPFVVYGIITETSIGHLFMAGIFPGILLSALFCGTIYIICLRNPQAGPAGDPFNLRLALRLPLGAWLTILLMLFVLGGIYVGIFTPTEAGALGAFGAFILGLATRRLKWNNFVTALTKTITTACMILILIIGANIFSTMLALSTVPFALVDIIKVVSVNKWVVLAAVLILYIIVGFVLDIMSSLLILIPIITPILVKVYGFDPVWLGVLTILCVCIGEVTPPIGIVVFAVGGVAKDIPLSTIFRGAMYFFWAMLVCLVILVIFPEISLFIPNTMYGM